MKYTFTTNKLMQKRLCWWLVNKNQVDPKTNSIKHMPQTIFFLTDL